jgi:hypothetical protein
MTERLHLAILLAIAIALNITLAGVLPACAFEATLSGSTVSVTGTTSPGEQISLRSSFTMNLLVSGGQYEYETRVEIPPEPNRFSVTARNVKDFNAGVKMGIWITKRFQANGGTASISHANVPAGSYDLKMFGEALPGSNTVPVDVVAETQVKADAGGKYNLDIDTSGVPAGEYKIEAAGETRTIQIGGSSPDAGTTSSTASRKEDGSSIEEMPAQQKAKRVGITSETVHWFANETGRTIATPGEYQDTEKQLRQRLSGDYWKIISRGDPLTEQAGNCEQEFCLVRDKDACTVCRDKDVLLKSGQSPQATNPAIENQVPASQDRSESQSLNDSKASNQTQEKGLIERIGEWANQLFGRSAGG